MAACTPTMPSAPLVVRSSTIRRCSGAQGVSPMVKSTSTRASLNSSRVASRARVTTAELEPAQARDLLEGGHGRPERLVHTGWAPATVSVGIGRHI